MTTVPWTAEQMYRGRLIALDLLNEGNTPAEVAEVLGVSVRSVQRWARAAEDGGAGALAPRPRTGRPPKLAPRQADRVLAWVEQPATDFGFVTGRWTARRLAAVVQRRLGVAMHPRYLSDWLRRHGVTPQIPARRAAERDQRRIDAWVEHDWPRIKKRRPTSARRWHSRTKADSCCCRWCTRLGPRADAPPCSRTGRTTGTRCRLRRR